MKGEEKYLARHHLDVYSEMKFSDFLDNKGFHVFFPFEDRGIDIAPVLGLVIPTNPSRRENSINYTCSSWRLGTSVSTAITGSLGETSDIANFYWVFCALKPDGDFDFFVFPQKIVEEWMRQRSEGLKKKGKKFGDKRFLKLEPTEDREYIMRSESYIEIDPNQYCVKIK